MKVLSDGRLSDALLFDFDPETPEYIYRDGIFRQFAEAALRSLEPRKNQAVYDFPPYPWSGVYRVSIRPGNEAGYKILEFFAERQRFGGIDFGLETSNSLEFVFGPESSPSPVLERKKILAVEFLALAKPDKKVLDIMETALADPSPGVREAAAHSFKQLRKATKDLDLFDRERRANSFDSLIDPPHPTISPIITERLGKMRVELITRQCRESMHDLRSGRVPGPVRAGGRKLLQELKFMFWE